MKIFRIDYYNSNFRNRVLKQSNGWSMIELRREDTYHKFTNANTGDQIIESITSCRVTIEEEDK